MEERLNEWHLDKRVPTALIIAMTMQLAGFVWWASNIDARMANVEGWRQQQEESLKQIQRTSNVQAVQLGRIEENSRNTLRMVQELTRRLETEK